MRSLCVEQWVLVLEPASYTHLRANETVLDLVCRLLLEKKKHVPSLQSVIMNRVLSTYVPQH